MIGNFVIFFLFCASLLSMVWRVCGAEQVFTYRSKIYKNVLIRKKSVHFFYCAWIIHVTISIVIYVAQAEND